MKDILLITCLLVLGSTGFSVAQLEGKQFLSGSAGINFDNANPESSGSTNNYSYQFDVSLGKFKSETRAAGWRISHSLGGGKMAYNYYNGSQVEQYDRNGLNRLGVGLGRFWHFYKQFNDKLGIYAGPEAGVSFLNTKGYSTEYGPEVLTERRTQKIELALGLSAGIYYAFSEKWWVTARLAFANPVSVDYSFHKTRNVRTEEKDKGGELTYRFSPVFNFPSAGLGLRYFYNR
jgi:hypothetical protein